MSNISPYQCPHIPQLKERCPQRISLQEIQHSTAAGCLLCPVLLAAVEPLIVDESSTLVNVQSRNASGLRLIVEWGGKEKQESDQIELFCSEDTGEGLIPKSRPICDNTGDEAAFELIKEWSMTCVEKHQLLCNRMSDNSGLLPHRVLDVGPAPTPQIVLKETTESDIGHYACLSHCWGGHQPLQTTRATLAERKNGIAWEELPKTFQEAVSSARRLNLRYLWIDSLCIIQDSDDDWGVESALMADIYRNATITLSAAASKGPHDGLFLSTSSQHRAVKLIPGFVEPPSTVHSFFTRRPLSSSDHWRECQPLLSRGWVLQERLLSPRVIHFGAYELIWECMQSSDCECGSALGSLTWFTEKLNFHPAALSVAELPFTANAWRKIVRDFSGLSLTFGKDVFPSVSGLAKIVKQSLVERGVQANYIAGMWDCWFVEDCLWSMDASAARPTEWRAPTFSWASVLAKESARLRYKSWIHFETAWKKGELEIYKKALIVYAALKSYERELAGPDETGRLRSASVILTGPLLQAKLSRGELIVLGQKFSADPEFKPDYDFSVPGQYHVDTDATLWCLQLASLRVPLKKPLHEYLWFLVLRQTSIEKNGLVVYERVGLLRYRENCDSKRPIERWFDEEKIIQDAIVKIV